MPVPPSMSSGAAADHGMHGVRTGADVAVKSEAALKLLKQGNERLRPHHLHGHARGLGEVRPGAPQRHPWLCGLASAHRHRLSMPGDLFVLRNAGNTCTHAAR